MGSRRCKGSRRWYTGDGGGCWRKGRRRWGVGVDGCGAHGSAWRLTGFGGWIADCTRVPNSANRVQLLLCQRFPTHYPLSFPRRRAVRAGRTGRGPPPPPPPAGGDDVKLARSPSPPHRLLDARNGRRWQCGMRAFFGVFGMRISSQSQPPPSLCRKHRLSCTSNSGKVAIFVLFKQAA
ncbi:hypothetical protein L1887_53635 [Cichorium endivia]|nr:hypothetical protein L1887_53635 [Cichorium endivia]